jgi:hypothetical protein
LINELKLGATGGGPLWAISVPTPWYYFKGLYFAFA